MIYTSENKSINAIYTNDGQSIGIIYDNNGNIIWQKNSIMPIRFYAFQNDKVEEYDFTLKNDIILYDSGSKANEAEAPIYWDSFNSALTYTTYTDSNNIEYYDIKEDNALTCPVDKIQLQSSYLEYATGGILTIQGYVESFYSNTNNNPIKILFVAEKNGQQIYRITRQTTTTTSGYFSITLSENNLFKEYNNDTHSYIYYDTYFKVLSDRLLTKAVISYEPYFNTISEPYRLRSTKTITFNNFNYIFSNYTDSLSKTFPANTLFKYKKPDSIINFKEPNSNIYPIFLLGFNNELLNEYGTYYLLKPTLLSKNHFELFGFLPYMYILEKYITYENENETQTTPYLWYSAIGIKYILNFDAHQNLNGDHCFCVSFHGDIPSDTGWKINFILQIGERENPEVIEINSTTLKGYSHIVFENEQITSIIMNVITTSNNMIKFLNTTFDIDLIEGIAPIYANYFYQLPTGEKRSLPSLPVLTCRNGLNIFNAKEKCNDGNALVRIPRVFEILPIQNVTNQNNITLQNLTYDIIDYSIEQTKGIETIISNYRIYGKTLETYPNLFETENLRFGASESPGIANQLYTLPISIQNGKTYTIRLNDYEKFNFKINTNLNNNIPWAANKHNCGDPQNNTWQNQEISFTASQNGYLIISIVRGDNPDLPISLDYASQQELIITVVNDTPVLSGVGNYSQNTNKYSIPININGKISEITLDTPLLQGQYIDYKTQLKYNNDSTTTAITLPQLKLDLQNHLEDSNIAVNTNVTPSSIEIEISNQQAINEKYGKISTIEERTIGKNENIVKFVSQGNDLINYRIYGAGSVGIGDTIDDNICIPIQINDQTQNIIISTPLKNDEYIDYATQKRYNADETEQNIELPTISTNFLQNIFKVNTSSPPSRIVLQGNIYGSSQAAL